MILPIISAISREVFRQVPREHVEAALALGATRWEMIRTVGAAVRPGRHDRRLDARPRPGARRDASRSPSCCPPCYAISWHLTEPGGDTFASNIALKFGEAGDDRHAAP